MQQQTTTSSRKGTGKFVFKNNPQKFSSKCQRHFLWLSYLKIVVHWRAPQVLYGEHFQFACGESWTMAIKDTIYPQICMVWFSLSILGFNINSSPFIALRYKLEIPNLWPSFIKLGIPTNTSLNYPNGQP
jgi:hypothetical protein